MERHRDQGRDQARDHVTKPARPNLTKIAESVIEAIAVGAPEIFELSAALARAVLEDELVQRAGELRELLQAKSAFAMVRAVELATRVLEGQATTGLPGGASPTI